MDIKKYPYLSLLFSTLLVSFVFASSASGQDIQTVAVFKKADSSKNLLISLTSPIAGYRSTTGTIYDFIPIAFEAPFGSRIGVRAQPSLLYYDSEFQNIQLLIGLPIYQHKSVEGQMYCGFFAGPILVGALDLTEGGGSVGRGGLSAGYAWNLGEGDWRISLGLWHLFSSTFAEQGDTGLNFEVGLWF